jgi:UDP-N-acetylmuramoyl-L-alanyl-D-glutamate--2,6-diaminopimelate ligase
MTARSGTGDLASGGRSVSVLQQVLRAVDDLHVKRLVTDSRQLRPGDTFVALPGDVHDGRDYIAHALARGAASVLWEKRGFAWNPRWHAPNIGIANLRRRAGEIANHVHGCPSSRLWMIGVTGTNGKTSCSQWIAQSLTRAGRRCAVIGTLGSGFPGRLEADGMTTPDAVSLHGKLASLVRRGARAVCMEASSHGLVQHRLAGVDFDLALLTNVTRDHLDYHGTMRHYETAKARLFGWESLRWAVLNLDDRFGRELAARVHRPGLNVVGYGFDRRLPAAGRARLARVEGRNLRVGLDGVAFDVTSPWGSASVRSPMVGRFNAANLLGSLATLLASDMKLDASVAALAKVAPVPGRTERFGGGSRPLVVVDYAHTPDALEKVLRALRELATPRSTTRACRQPRLICVFGCGGERDRGKRPLMGRIAARLADRVIVTSDNPRGEDPLAIIREIMKGMRGEHLVEPDRAAAIRKAVSSARRGDIVLVAGKGHERYQEIRGARHRFDDRAAVRAALAHA